jgi:hypothetical protein
MRRILAVGGLATGLALGFVAGSGLGRTSTAVATCTAAQHTARVHAAASYRRRMPRDRAAYFRRHHGSHQRARYIHAQQARLHALEKAAACHVPKPKPHTTTNPISSTSTTTAPTPPVSTTTAAGTTSTTSTSTTVAATSTTTTTVPNPPAAAVSYEFGPELGAADRAWVTDEGDAAGAWLQALTGVTLNPIKVYAYTDPHGLAVAFQKHWGFDPSVIPTKEAQYRAGNTAAEASLHATFLNLFQTSDWGSPASNRQKIIGHELFHLEQQQLANAPTGIPPSDGPIWLVEGSAETMGYRVAAARALLDLPGERADLAARVRGTSVTLTSLETSAGLSQAHAWDTLHLAADHLTAIAPKGIGSFVDYYAALGAGTEWHGAFLAAFGMTSAQYYTAFDAYRVGL